MTTFQAGKTYMTRSICDANMMISLTIVARTAKTVTTSTGKKLRVKEYAGIEQVMPWGNYSMAPRISADKVVA